MSYKDLDRIEKIQKLNANDNKWVNKDLYRLMYKPDFYITAYERIKSNAGNMTKGSDDTTLDGFSETTIRNIILNMRNESFKFKGARKVLIPKANGKKRTLGIAPPRDKVVQEVIRMILEAIYEPTFNDHSHGFRPNRGCHTALKEIRKNWSGVCWIIEGDIKGCFDNINHELLINILSKRIDDSRFLNLIRKALKAGYFEFGEQKTSIVGTPQGSIVSPILANIFLDEFDNFIENEVISKYQNETPRKINPAYRSITSRMERVRKEIDHSEGEDRINAIRVLRELKKESLEVSPVVVNGDGCYIRIKYIRYADDWMIGVNGSHELAAKIRNELAEYLMGKLELTLSMEKTHIRHAKTENAYFLGTNIQVGRGLDQKVQKIKRHGITFTKRVAGWTPSMFAPVDKLVRKLSERGLCDKNGNPKSKDAWILLDDWQINEKFDSILRGLLNYYSFVDNYCDLRRIQYILKYSAAKTLAGKHRTSVRQIFKKHGEKLTVKVYDEKGKVKKSRSLKLEKDWSSKPSRFKINNPDAMEGKVNTYIRLRTRSKLYSPCVICGETESKVWKCTMLNTLRKLDKMLKGSLGF